MSENTDTVKPLSYTVTEMPLTQDDIKKLEKILSGSYKANILLLPLLAMIYFWGVLYFAIFFAFVVICNVSFTNNYFSTKQALTKTKIIVTGIVTILIEKEETIINFGSEQFDITYANMKFPIQVRDIVSIHYSKKANNSRGHLLSVEIINQSV